MDDAVVDMSELPGEGLAFEDVTSVFANASLEMDAETMYFMEGFTLMDAMSAFEIGEPRLDTGYAGEHPVEPLNPFTPLLPEEVCWILDRALAAEMEWHSGNMLAHTVFTLTYIYELGVIDDDYRLSDFFPEEDPQRPIELITGVLGPYIQGVLKCVDLTWRELRNNELIHDSEDWQSDKCEVPVLEGVPVSFILEKLQNAANFAGMSSKIPENWRQPLRTRILLRKTLLELYDMDVCKHHADYQNLLNRARECLEYITSEPDIQVPDNSPARAAFDPYISRRLNTCVPVRIVPVVTGEMNWSTLRSFLDGLQEMTTLVVRHHLSIWEVFILHKLIWLPLLTVFPGFWKVTYLAQRSPTPCLCPFGDPVLDQFSFTWALDQLFSEATGHSWSDIVATVKEAWTQPTPPPIPQIERKLYKLIIHGVKSSWFNPSRRRRYLMKAVVDWHEVYDFCITIAGALRPNPDVQNHIATKLPQVVSLFRLEAIREIVLAGFQLELYTPEERPYAYYYTSRVVEAHIECCDEILPFIAGHIKPFQEMTYQRQVLQAIGSLSHAMFLITAPLVSFDWDQTRPSFYRRYKWAYRSDYDRIQTPPLAHPDLYEFMRLCMDLIHDEESSPQSHIQYAEATLKEILATKNTGGWADQWMPERLKVRAVTSIVRLTI
ncbi:hypothetical protein MD484_g6206, partial [Candolleomyces efflorescens]